MNKDKKILIIIVVALVALASVFGFLAYQKSKNEPAALTDAMKFKNEYEKYNGVVNDSNKLKYPDNYISEKNPIKYLSDDAAAEILKSGTGIIYFGFPTCPWCRSMIPMLLKAAESTNLGELGYVDIESIRNQLSLDDNNNIVTTKEGTNGYKSILKSLDEVLDKYILTSKDGKKIDTGEKRLFAPTVVVVKDGKVLDIHIETVSTQTNGFATLSQKEQEELFAIYQKMILKIQDEACNDNC